jgi:hypothetical protein
MRLLFLSILSFCCYFSLLAQTAVNQTSIAFHTTMKPGVVYRQNMQTETSLALNYDSMSQELKDALQNNPAIENAKKMQVMMETEARCGKPDAGTGIMPIRMTVTKDSGSMIATVLPVGSNFYGHVSPGKMPVFDSTDISGGTQTQAMLDMMKNISVSVALPDTTMSVGQTYTQVIPIDIPTGAMKLKMVMTQAFTLKGYSKDTAGFDIVVKGTLDVGGAEVPITGTAEGVGHMIYNRKESYPTYTRLSLKMRIAVSQAGNVMHMEVGSKQLIQCVIVKE